jgi:hypothetical protein
LPGPVLTRTSAPLAINNRGMACAPRPAAYNGVAPHRCGRAHSLRSRS